MAAKDIEHLKEHFLSCDICMEIYEDPVTLACGHTHDTFCRKCYIRYCKENREATRKKNIQCPTCKQCSDVAEWEKQLKPSLIIRGLLDDFVASVGKTEDCLRSSKRKIRDVCSKCLSKSALNYYCKKCKMSVCSDCGLQNHNKCGDIVQIESLKPELKLNLNDNLETLKRQMQNTEQWMKTVERQMENLRRMESKVREDITSNCESAVKLIREWERKTLDELSSVTEQQFEQQRAQLKAGETDLQMFRQYSEFISRSLRYSNGIDMIDMYEKCKSGEILKTCSTQYHEIAELQLVGCFSQEEILKNCHLGNIIFKKAKSVTLDVTTANLLDTIDMRVTGDTDTPDLLDVSVVEVGGVEVVVATDYKYFSLKSYYKPRVMSLKLGDRPYRVARMSSNQVAVSLPYAKKIVLVNVTPILQSTITTQREYHGLTSLDESTLAAGCRSPPCVDILDIRGRVKKTITPGGSLIQSPDYLSTTQEGNILVSDRGSKSVVCLTPEGDVVFTYSPTGDRALGSPRGITTTTTGDILVADYWNNKVIQLTGAGEYVRDLLTSQDGMWIPRGISVLKDRLYVSQRGYPLKVFRL